ncbi:MAG: hypothetical protein EOO22_25125 [Comamonadaceae bacterium]|nr:MAG: hypothetical protein EOO22_25125 [Comamonadaceae bacterium]
MEPVLARPPSPQLQPPAFARPPAPPGHRLAVRESPPLATAPDGHATAADTTAAPEATGRVLAMPVRVQPASTARDQPRDSEGTAIAPPIPPSEDGDFWHATVTQMVVAEAISAESIAF